MRIHTGWRCCSSLCHTCWRAAGSYESGVNNKGTNGHSSTAPSHLSPANGEAKKGKSQAKVNKHDNWNHDELGIMTLCRSIVGSYADPWWATKFCNCLIFYFGTGRRPPDRQNLKWHGFSIQTMRYSNVCQLGIVSLFPGAPSLTLVICIWYLMFGFSLGTDFFLYISSRCSFMKCAHWCSMLYFLLLSKSCPYFINC